MEFILAIVVLIFSVIIHEVSHGLMAYYLGDPTAKYAGRLTLNPIPHIDPIGSIAFPLLMLISAPFLGGKILLGWAKPVPYNPYNLKNQRWGSALVGLAGPLSNILLALVAGLTMRVLLANGIENALLDIIVTINISLAVFNLFPFPPLDGSKLLFSILPLSDYTKAALEQYSFVFLIVLITIFSSLITALIRWAVYFFYNVVVY